MFVYPPCSCLMLTEAKRVELQVIVSCLRVSGNPTLFSIIAVSAIHHRTPLQPDPRTLKSVYHGEAPSSVFPVVLITVVKPWISNGEAGREKRSNTHNGICFRHEEEWNHASKHSKPNSGRQIAHSSSSVDLRFHLEMQSHLGVCDMDVDMRCLGEQRTVCVCVCNRATGRCAWCGETLHTSMKTSL